METWSEIPIEIARKIAMEHLDNVDDFEAFGEVCSLWRSAVQDVKYFCPLKNTQIPWLMLADPPESSYRRFYSLSKSMLRQIDVPQLDHDDKDDHQMYYSSKGWLISVSRFNRNITLFNPFSAEVIKPPSIPLEFMESHRSNDPWDERDYLCHFQKFIFSVNSSSCDDFAVAMMFDKTQKLAFWKPGQLKWTKPTTVDFEVDWVLDVCFFKGEFYAIDHHGVVMAFGGQGDTSTRKPRIITNLGVEGQGFLPLAISILYIREVENRLLVLHRHRVVGDDDHATQFFKAFEVNVDDGKAKQVKSVGNRAVFVGLSSTFYVEASSHEHYGCRANCIYFTDDYCEGFRCKVEEEPTWVFIAWKKGKLLTGYIKDHHNFVTLVRLCGWSSLIAGFKHVLNLQFIA